MEWGTFLTSAFIFPGFDQCNATKNNSSILLRDSGILRGTRTQCLQITSNNSEEHVHILHTYGQKDK